MGKDLYRRFRPNPSQRRFIECKARGRLLSSGYGGGKSKLGCREGIRWSIQYPGSRGLIGRLTATDLRDTTMVTFWREIREIGFEKDKDYVFNKSTNTLEWWNGSEIAFRHLDDPLALGSLELTWAFVDEGAEVADSVMTTLYSSRLRWHLPDCPATAEVSRLIEAGAPDEEVFSVRCPCPHGMWSCTNPGASGFLRAVTRGEVDGWEWIPVPPGENRYNGPDYYAQMERLRAINGDIWMKRYYEGSWDAFEGQRFTMFDRERHVLADAWRPTDEHRVVCGWDFGHVETFVAFIAYHPTRHEPIVVFDEIVANELVDPADIAVPVKERLAHYDVGIDRVMHMGDPAGTGSGQFSSISPIGAYSAFGLHINPARKGKNPLHRADLLTAFLNESRVQPDGSSWPGIVFGPNTPRSVYSIVNLRWKQKSNRLGEDPREVFVDKDKHGFDAVTYGLYGVPPPNLPKRTAGRIKGANIGARQALQEFVG